MLNPHEFGQLMKRAKQVFPQEQFILKKIEEEYRWLYPYSLSPTVGEKVSVAPSKADPTQTVVITKQDIRTRARNATRRLEELTSTYERIHLEFEKVLGEFHPPELDRLLEYDRSSPPVGPRYVRRQRDIQRKRHERGEGFGES